MKERGPNAYDFTHDKIRDVAYGETSAPRSAASCTGGWPRPWLPCTRETSIPSELAGRRALRERRAAGELAIPYYSRARRSSQRASTPTRKPVPSHRRGLYAARRARSERGGARDGWELELQLVVAPSARG